jgi:hypothetical protein
MRALKRLRRVWCASRLTPSEALSVDEASHQTVLFTYARLLDHGNAPDCPSGYLRPIAVESLRISPDRRRQRDSGFCQARPVQTKGRNRMSLCTACAPLSTNRGCSYVSCRTPGRNLQRSEKSELLSTERTAMRRDLCHSEYRRAALVTPRSASPTVDSQGYGH